MNIRGTPLHGFPDQFSHETNDRRLFTLDASAVLSANSSSDSAGSPSLPSSKKDVSPVGIIKFLNRLLNLIQAALHSLSLSAH
jgi:hypothetical protein